MTREVRLFSNDAERVGIVFNVLLNSEEKLSRLMVAIQRLSYIEEPKLISIRVRGQYSQTAARRILDLKSALKNCEVKIQLGSNYSTWRLDTLSQVIRLRSSIVLLLQEDHWLVDPLSLDQLLQDFEREKVDFCPLSFQPQVSRALKGLERMPSDDTIFGGRQYFTQKPRSKTLANEYAVSLVGAFKREKLISLLQLEDRFPIKYPVESPFLFEKRFSDPRIYPLVIAFPKREVFACVDDDHGVDGYSLMARGKVKTTRTISHRGEIIDKLSILWASIVPTIPKLLRGILPTIFNFPIYLVLSARWLLGRRKYRTEKLQLLLDG